MTLLQSAVFADLLQDAGVPYARPVGSLVTFVLAFLVVYLVGRAVLGQVVSRVLDRRGLDVHARRPLQKLTRVAIVFAAVAIGFGLAGYGSFLGALATVAAAATLAVGFALQDVIANFVAGVFIYTDRPFRIGDWVEWDGNSGVVADISLRVTRVRTFDNELLTVPNAQLTDGVIKNPVANEQLRMKFLFGIGYDDDIDRATEVIIEEAERHDDILEDPAPSVRLTELGSSSVGLQSRVWIANPSRASFVRTRGEYVTAVKERFDKEGIDIPYPNRTIGGDLAIDGAELAEPADD
jgi:Small-conductance mechanosensitive channel